MTITPNRFKRGLLAQQPQAGLWVSLGSSMAAEVIAHAGFDWVVIDMEHAVNDYFSVLAQLQALASSPTTALVRPEWNDPIAVKRLMDIGVAGLVFPMVQTVAEAEKAVAATRYPPKGIRGVAGATRATRFGRIPDYVHKVEAETAIIIQLETMAALAQAEAIAAVDGVDGIFFGPADIAADLGQVGKPMAAEVWQAIRPVAQRLIAQGVPVGTLVTDADFARTLFAEGFNFVACGLDSILLARASDALVRHIKD